MARGAKYEWLLLGDAVDRAAQMWGDRPAAVFGERRWNYTEFAAEVDRVAKGLMAQGAQRGDHVAVWMTNLPEWLWLQYGIAKVGGCIVPLNTRYRTDDVAYTVAQSESRFMIDPFKFDVLRDPNPQYGYGGPGPHYCLGAHLARREMTVMYRELFNRLPDIVAVSEPDALQAAFIHGVKHLDAEFTPTAPLAA